MYTRRCEQEVEGARGAGVQGAPPAPRESLFARPKPGFGVCRYHAAVPDGDPRGVLDVQSDAKEGRWKL